MGRDWIGLRVGFNSSEKELGSKKGGWGLNNSTLCDTSRVPELHGKVFPFQHNSHSAAVSQTHWPCLSYVANKTTISLVKGLSSHQRWSMHPCFNWSMKKVHKLN